VKLLTEKELAKELAISLATLRRRRAEGRPPLFVIIGASVRYRKEDIDAFIQSSVKPITGKEVSNDYL
jgi:predicted DNA-binding transcriptional regulator AlpA